MRVGSCFVISIFVVVSASVGRRVNVFVGFNVLCFCRVARFLMCRRFVFLRIRGS